MTHQYVQLFIIIVYLVFFVWCCYHPYWENKLKKHIKIAVLFTILFFAWQYHAYIITWLHLSPHPLIQDEMPDAHMIHGGM